MASDDAPPKTAYELALQRLEAKDRQAGIETRRLTDAQKGQIAELRTAARAKLAEKEILHRKHRAEAEGDIEQLRELDEHYEIDRRRIESRLEDDVEQIKSRPS